MARLAERMGLERSVLTTRDGEPRVLARRAYDDLRNFWIGPRIFGDARNARPKANAPHGAFLRHFLAQNEAEIGPMRHRFGPMRHRIAAMAKKQGSAVA
jgi:hypothetical protein